MNDQHGNRKSILRRFLQGLKEKIFRRPKVSLRRRLVEATYNLNTALNGLEQTVFALKRRSDNFFEKCVEAQQAGDNLHAIMYANECAEARKLTQLVTNSELALEQAILRIQTIEKLGDAAVAVAPVIRTVQETREMISGIIPSVADRLEEANAMLSLCLGEMGTAPRQAVSPRAPTEEAVRVLEEAKVTAEEKVRERFPELLPIPEASAETKVPVALTASGGDWRGDGGSLKQQVYEYVKACDGELSVHRCASYLRVPQGVVKKFILKLEDEGKITLVET